MPTIDKWLDRTEYILRHPKDFLRLLAAMADNALIGFIERFQNRRKAHCSICGFRGNEFRNMLERHFILWRQQCPVCGSLRRNRGMLEYLFKLPKPPGSPLILEVGPLWANHRALDGPFRYVAADLDRPRPRLDVTPRSIRTRAESLPLPDKCAFIVLSSHCLEHVENDIEALREFHRVLRPGGHLLLDVPFENIPHTFELDKVERMGHRRVYGEDFPERVRKQGFEVETRIYFNLPNPTQEETFFHCRPI